MRLVTSDQLSRLMSIILMDNISPEDKKAIEGLCLVASRDVDRATYWNKVGFSGNDTDFGNSLVDQWKKRQWLSPKQWMFVRKLAHKYRVQIETLRKSQMQLPL